MGYTMFKNHIFCNSNIGILYFYLLNLAIQALSCLCASRMVLVMRTEKSHSNNFFCCSAIQQTCFGRLEKGFLKSVCARCLGELVFSVTLIQLQELKWFEAGLHSCDSCSTFVRSSIQPLFFPLPELKAPLGKTWPKSWGHKLWISLYILALRFLTIMSDLWCIQADFFFNCLVFQVAFSSKVGLNYIICHCWKQCTILKPQKSHNWPLFEDLSSTKYCLWERKEACILYIVLEYVLKIYENSLPKGFLLLCVETNKLDN
jgi:hypothetical protein